MTSENTFPDDLYFLTTLTPINDFRATAENYAGLSNYIKFASSLNPLLEPGVKEALRQKIETKIASESSNPIPDFEEYGIWRVKHGEANYSQYVHARNINASRLPLLRNGLDILIWFENEAESILGQFSSIDDLVSVSNSLNYIMDDLYSSGDAETLWSPEIDEFDRSLCFAWSNEKNNFSLGKLKLSDVLDPYEAARLLSARAAEKSAAHYYHSLGERVIDVSSNQLLNSDEQWKDFDLLVEGRPIDVKNARKSFSSPDTYVEHCIPRYKHDRKYGTEVSIISVLSDYGFEDQIWSRELKCQILGEVNVSKIRKLYSWMHKRFGALLNLDGLWRQSYVPGWMFEYPKLHYKNRWEMLPQLAEVLNNVSRVCKSDGELMPGWILTLSPNSDVLDSITLSEIRRKLLRELLLLNTEVGFSRPSLFLYSMGVILESMLENSPLDNTAKVLRELLFVIDDDTHPLFLLDSQKYISNLITLLSHLHEQVTKLKIQFDGFSMPHPSILRGHREGYAPMTLIAYCGGWRKEPIHVKCGSAPLFFGKNEICLTCNHLICNDCGYCMDNCARYLRSV